MSDDKQSSLFPSTQKDISRLMQNATDAVNDLGNSSGDATGEKTLPVKYLVDFVSQRPLLAVGAALAVGFVLGIGCCVGSNRRR